MSSIWQLTIKNRSEVIEKTICLLEAAQASDWLGPKSAPIFLKPNLVVAKSASEGATTTPAVTEGLILFLKENGYNDLYIAEGSWVGSRTPKAFKVCGYTALSEKYGIELIDLQKDDPISCKTPDGTLSICRSIAGLADLGGSLINLPVLKGHGQTLITCALKNMKGCIPNKEKRRFHSLGVHKPLALLNTVIKPAFHLVDGLNGDPGWEEGGSPQDHNLLFLGKDSVSIDSYAARLLGYTPDEIDYINYALDYNIGELFTPRDLIDLDSEKSKNIDMLGNQTKLKEQKAFFSSFIEEREACSSCYGHLTSALKSIPDKKLDQLIRTKKLKLFIGQYFVGQQLPTDSVGIGSCTDGAGTICEGCPPSIEKIKRFLIQ